MLSGHEKYSKDVFAKRFKKNSAASGIKLLPASLPASGYTAKPLSFGVFNRRTVYNYTLYEKQENEKVVAKHVNGFEPAIREKARALI